MSRTLRNQLPEYKDEYDSSRDGKKWYKADKIYKKLRSKTRKAKEKQSLIQGKEDPKFKRANDYE